MQRMSLTFINDASNALHSAPTLTSQTARMDVFWVVYNLKDMLEPLLHSSIYSSSLRVCRHSGTQLLAACNVIVSQTDLAKPLEGIEIYTFNVALDTFKVTFRAELETMNAYLVTTKRGYDILTLISSAAMIFPPDLLTKVPEVEFDVSEAGKCLAFEVPTAASFHLFRALETVIKAYWPCVVGEAPLPDERNLGQYITKMQDAKVPGTEKVLAALKQIKDLHRNPLMHPEDQLNLDECIGLLNIVQSAIVSMLIRIPGREALPLPLKSA